MTGNPLSQSHVHFLLSSCRNWIKRTLHYPLGKGLALSCSPTQCPCKVCFSAGATEPGKNPGSDTLKEAYLLSLWSHHKQNRLWMPAYQNVVGEKHMGGNNNSLMSKFTALTFLEQNTSLFHGWSFHLCWGFGIDTSSLSPT